MTFRRRTTAFLSVVASALLLGLFAPAPAAMAQTAPTIQVALGEGATVKIYFSEPLDSASVPDPSAFTVTVDGDTSSHSVSAVTISDTEVKLALSAGLSTGSTATLGYTVPDTNPIQSLNGSNASGFNRTVQIFTDTTAPSLSDAVVEGTTLTLTYDEGLDPTSVPDNSAFSVTVDSGTATNPSSVSVSGFSVTLTLASAVTPGQTVKLVYVVPGTNPIQDAASNAAARLPDQAVTNNTQSPPLQSSDATLSALSVTGQTLDQPFAPGTTVYTLSVGNDVTSVDVTATVNEGNASLAGSLTKAGGTPEAVTMTSGTAATLSALAVGNNVLTITVTAEDGTTQAYTLTVTRTAVVPPPVTQDPVLVGNTGQTDANLGNVRLDITQAFTTGSHSAGYTLTAVDVQFHPGTRATPDYTVEIRSDSSGAPGTLVATLSGPDTLVEGINQFSASGTGVALDANTTYWFVWDVPTGSSHTVRIGGTTSTDEDAGHSAGWSIADISYWRQPGDTGSWTLETRARKIAIRGTEKTATDTTAPVLSTATVDGTTLTLTYNEALDTNSVPADSDFTVNVGGTPVSLAANNPVAISGSAVTLTLASAVTSSDTVTVSYVVPSSNPIQDAASNTAAALSDQAVTNNTVDTTPPVLQSLAASEDVITMIYNEALDETSVPDGGDFIVQVDGDFVGLAASDPVDVSGSTVLLTLQGPADAGETVRVQYLVPTTPGAGRIQDLVGNAAAGADMSTTAEDTTAPVFSAASVDGTSLTLTWNEALDTGSTPAASAFTVTVDGTTASLAATSPVSISGATVVLTLAEAVNSAGQTVTVSYAVPATNPIRDAAQNAVAALTDETVTVVDTTRPVLQTASVEGDVLTLTYDERLDTTSVPDNNSFLVSVNGVPEFFAADDGVAISGNTVVLTLEEAVPSGQTVTLQYQLPSPDNRIKDLAGNEAVGFNDRSVTYADTTAPTLSTATVDGTTLTLTWSEALDTNSVPADSDFTVKVGGTSVSLAATSPVAVSGSTVTLTLASAVTSSDTVTVTYTVGTNPIQDEAGNDAAALTDQVVANNTPAPPPINMDSVLVSNTGQTTHRGWTTTRDFSQRFTTGSHPAGYMLTGVDVRFTVNAGGQPTYAMEIRSNGSDNTPGTLVATLSKPDTLVAGNNRFDVPGGGILLSADTTYHVFMDVSAQSFSVRVSYTDLDAEDTGAAQGWSIANDGHRRSYNSSSWTSNLDAAQVALIGYAAEAAPPNLDSATVAGTTLTLTYDRALDTASVPTADSFTVKVNNTEVSLAPTDAVSVAGSAVTLTLAAAVSAGATVTVSYAVPSSNPIQNADGNAAAALTDQTVSHVDTTAPTLSTATVEGTTLTLTYDEALDTNSVPDATAFLVTVDSGTATNPSMVAVAGMEVTLTLASAVSPGSTVTLNYTVPSSNPIQDAAANAAAVLNDQDVTIVDTTAPTLSTARVDGTVLTLTYDEVLDTNSVPADTDFTVTVDGTSVSLAATDPVSFFGPTVVLTLATAVTSSNTVTVTYTPGTSPIQDADGNGAAALTNQAVSHVDTTAPTLSTLSVKGTVLTLTWSEALDTTSVPAGSDFMVIVDGTTVSLAASNPVAISGSTVVLTLAAAVSDSSTVTVSYTSGTNLIQDPDGNVADNFTGRAVTVVETTPPVLSSATVEGTTLTLTYDETLDTNSVPDATAFSVTVDSGTAVTPSSVEIAGSAVVLTLASAVESAGQTVTVSYVVPDTRPIQDGNGNTAAALTNEPVAIAETTAPVLSSATVEGTTLTLTYDETLDTNSVPDATAFSVTVDSGTATNPSTVAVAGMEVTLTLATAVGRNSTVTVSYTVPGTNPIRDRAATPNAAVALTDEPVTVVDTTAPVLSAAEVDGTALTLTFNEALDDTSVSAGSAFTVTVDGTGNNVTGVSVTGSTVELTLTSAVSPGSAVTVGYAMPTSNPIRDPDGNTVIDFTGRAVTVLDTAPPVLSIATVDATVMVLSYDEQLDTDSVPDASAFMVEVDGTQVNLADTSPVFVFGLSVVLTLDTAVSPGSTATVSYAVPSLNPIQDEAGNPAAALTDRDVIVADSVGPVLSDATAEGTTLTLTYDETLDTNSVPDATAFSVTVNSGTAVNPSSVEISGSAVELTLASAVSPGQTVTVSYVVPDTRPIQDGNGNAAAALTDEPVTIADATAPVLSSATVEGTALTLTYDETLDTNSVPDATAFSVTVDSGTATNPSMVAVADMEVTLTLASAVGRNSTVTVSYVVPASNPIRDRAATPNAAVALTDQPVTVVDTTAPALSAAEVDGTALTLTFNEALDDTSVPAGSDFTVTVGGTGNDVTGVSVTGSTVELTLTSAVSPGQAVTVGYAAGTNPIRDADGNTVADFTGRAVTVLDTVAPVLSVATVEGTVMVLAYNELLDEASVPAESAFTVEVDGTQVSLAATDPVAVSGSSVVLTLATAVTPSQTVTVSYAIPGTNPIQDESGNAAAALTDRDVIVGDLLGPVLSDATVDGTTLTLTYDEPLDTNSVPATTAFSVTVDSGTAVTPSSVEIAGSAVELTLATAVGPGQVVTVNYVVPLSNPIQDGNGNGAAALTNETVTVLDTTAPTLSTAEVDGATLTLTWNEALDTGPVPASAFTVTVNGTTVNLAATDPVSVVGSAVILTLASEVRFGSTVAVSYTVPDTNPIRDVATNPAAALSDETVTVLDTTLPVFSAATAEGTALTLTYDELLDTNSVPAASAFTVTVNGNTRSLAANNPVAISGSTVSLTLVNAVTSGQTVTVSYAVPGTNPIQDRAGNDAAALTDRAVTVGDTTPPVLLSATVEGTALTLTWNEVLNTAPVPVSAFTVTVDGTRASPSSVSIAGSTVVLTLASAVNSGQVVTVSYAVLGTNSIRDRNGNAAAALTDRSVTVIDTVAPAFSTATVEGTALTLTWNEPLDTSSMPAATAFTVTVDGTGVNPQTVTVSGSSVVLTLATAVTPGQAVTVSYTVPATNPIRDRAANAAGALTDESVTVGDTVAPVFSTASVDGTALTLIYNEPLDTSSIPTASAFTVTVDGTGANPQTATVSGSSVVLTLATAVTPGQTVMVSYAVPATNPIRDLAGNAAGALTDRSVTAEDTVAPALSGASVEGTALTLIYNEPLDTSSIPTASAFTVTVDGTGANPQTATVSGSSVVLTLATAVTPGQTVMVSYAVPATNPIRDLAGNAAGALTDRSVTAGDTVAPALSDASVEGMALTLIYNEPLDTSSMPAASAFTVTVDGTGANPQAVTVSGSTVVLTLAEAVNPGQTVTVSYTVPATNPIRDAAGNATAALTDRAVAVVGTVAPVPSSDAALGALSVTDGSGASVGLSPVFSSATTAYTVALGEDVTSMRVTATANHDAATLSGSLTRAGGTAGTVALTSGMEVTLSNLTEGDNLLTITVTAEDGTTGTYTLTVTVMMAEVTVDTPMRPAALKKVLAAAGRRSLIGALDNIGARLGDAAPGPNLTLAGQTVGGTTLGLAGVPCETDAFMGADSCGSGVRGMTMSELFGSSAFSLTLGAAEGSAAGSTSPRWSFWGRGDLGRFEGRPDGTSYDGESGTFWLGADARAGNWVAGLAVSLGESETDYQYSGNGESGSGRLETDLTAIYPYGRWTLANGTEVRGLVGAGTGEVRHRSDDAAVGEKADLSMWMVSTGMRRALPSFSGLSLAAQGDLSLVRMETGNGPEAIDGIGADGWRMRAGVEASRQFVLDGGAMLEPFVEAAGRQDGGDGLSGTGLELAGGVRYRADRLNVEARGRWLAAHSERGAKEQGVSVTARLSPDAQGRGLSFALTPRWGAAADGAQALWGEEMPRVAENAVEVPNEASMGAALGYGIGMSRNALLTPFVETSVASDSRSRVLRLGARYEALRERALSLEVSGEQRESAEVETDQTLRLDLRIRF